MWSDASRVFIIDAAASNGKPGTIYRFDALHEKIPVDIFTRYSTHSISITETIELAKTLAQLPGSLLIFGVEGADFSPGIGLTPEVEKAAREVIRMLLFEIEEP